MNAKEFAEKLRASDRTKAIYVGNISRFLRWVEGREINDELAQAYIDYLESLGRKPNTLATVANALRAYWKVQKKELTLSAPTPQLLQPKYHTIEEVLKMLDMAKTPFEKVFVTLLFDSVPSYSPVIVKFGSAKSEEVDIMSMEELWHYINSPCITISTGKQIKIPEEPLLVIDGHGKGKIYSQVRYLLRHQYKGKLIRLNAHSGVVDISPNHSIVAGSKTKNSLRNACGVKLGEYVTMFDFGKQKHSNLWFFGDEELAWLYGFFLAEGSAYIHDRGENHPNGSFQISFSNSRQELLQKAEGIFSRFFGQRHFTYSEFKMSISCSRGLYKVFRNYFYCPDGQKRVPRVIINAPTEYKLAFLRGYNDGDGSHQKEYTWEFQRFSTNSQVAAMGLLWLLRTISSQSYSLQIRDDKPSIMLVFNKGERNNINSRIVKKIREINYEGFLYDIGTETEYFSTGVGLIRVHNTGARISEILDLETTDIDWNNRYVHVTLKGGLEADYMLSDTGVNALKEWLEVRKSNDHRIFMDYNYFYAYTVLKKLAQKAGIKEFTPHHLRHSFAFFCLSQGTTLYELQQLLKHRSINTTASFYGRSRLEHLRPKKPEWGRENGNKG